jgi:hypothetical protein
METEKTKNKKEANAAAPKKRVNSKAKGSGFEGKVSKILSESFAPMKFARTPGSGARVGGQNFGAFGKFFSQEALNLFVGDVVPVNEQDCENNFRFIVECKAYKDAEKLEALLSGSSNIYKWMEEVLVDSSKVERDGIVIFKWNNTPLYAAVIESITLPNIPRIILNNGIQVVHLQQLLEFKEFWFKPKK